MRKKPAVYITIVAAAAVLLAAGGFYWSRRGVRPVQTGRVARQDILSIVSASGEIKPKDYVYIRANAFGKIVEITVQEGARVRRGQTLARLESIQPAADVAAQNAQLRAAESDVRAAEATLASMEAGVKTAEAGLARTQAQRERLQQDFARAQSLHEEQLISRAAFEQAKAEFDVAVAAVAEAEARLAQSRAQAQQATAQAAMARDRVQQARANLERLRDTLEKHTFVAPLDGVVTDLPVNVGENVVPGIQNAPGSLLMTIADLSVITAEVLVDETDIGSIRAGQTAQVKVDAFPDTVFAGEVTEIGNTAIIRATGQAAAQSAISSQQAKDFKVVVTLAEAPEELRPGLSATAEIETAQRQNVLVVPLQALTIRLRRELASQDGDSVQAADAGGGVLNGNDEIEGVFQVRDGRAYFQPVKTGITGITDMEILSGVEPGDEIVTGSYEALRNLKSGDRVRVEEPSEDGREERF